MLPSNNKNATAFSKYLEKRISNGVRNIIKLFEEIKNQGYTGSYSSVYRLVKNSLGAKNRNQKILPHSRFETEPGEQAQVDWGSLGKFIINGKIYRLYCFVFVLGYSRAAYVELAVRQNLQTLEQCHIHAFEKLGIPRTILYDNTKTVVLRNEKIPGSERKIHYNPAFLDFSNYYGFQIKPCVPHRPQTKGKVESGVKYVKRNFMEGINKEKFSSLEEINKELTQWLEKFANVRVHATTHEKPEDRFLREKPFLKSVKNFPPYETFPFTTRNSTKDGFVRYKHTFYSIPPSCSQRKLFIKEINKSGIIHIEIYHKDKLIVSHQQPDNKVHLVIDDSHIVLRKKKISDTIGNIKIKLKKLRKMSKVSMNRSLNYYDQLIPKHKNGKIKN